MCLNIFSALKTLHFSASTLVFTALCIQQLLLNLQLVARSNTPAYAPNLAHLQIEILKYVCDGIMPESCLFHLSNTR